MQIFAKPFQVVGNIASLKNRQIVLSFSRGIPIFNELKKGDIVIYTSSEYPGTEEIGYILKDSGEKIVENDGYLRNDDYNYVPEGHFLIKCGVRDSLKIVSDDQVKYIVWFPLR